MCFLPCPVTVLFITPSFEIRLWRRVSKTPDHVVDQIDRCPVHVLLDPRLYLAHDRLCPPYKFAYDVHDNLLTITSL